LNCLVELLMERRFFLGCAVWAYKGWIGDLFPAGAAAKDLLRLYSRRLTTVEGNTTFYATPNEETVRRWAAETPEDFRFCFKLPREISHEGPLAAQIATTRAFVERMAPLGPRRGPFFLQLPPGFGPRQIDDLERWLAAWSEANTTPAADPKSQAARIAVEVRHLDWWAEPGEPRLMALLERYGAGRALLDVRPLELGPLPGAEDDLQRARDRKPVVPLAPLRSSDIALVRYIAHPDVPLNAPLLDEWAARVAGWLAAGAQVYVFMHCPVEERAPTLCREFQRRLERLADVPPLPWDAADDGPSYTNATLPGF
jgi:uncharacterized protein YecE (DUF72 family)